LVNAPLAHQRKLVEGADKSTTHLAKTGSTGDYSLPLPAPAEALSTHNFMQFVFLLQPQLYARPVRDKKFSADSVMCIP